MLDASTSSAGSSAEGFFILAIGAVAYFFPTIVAWQRETINKGGVLAINFLLGWTVNGWIIGLAMAAGGMTRAQLRGAGQPPTPAPAEAEGRIVRTARAAP